MSQPRFTPAPSNTAPATPVISTTLEFEDLTREQRIVLNRITQRFREAGVVQVLTGPHESGKTVLAELVGQCLDSETVTVLISKGADQPPAQKRLVQEAYASYPHMLGTILRQTGFYARREETDLVEQMVEKLRELRQSEKRLLLILDDAQDITPGVWKRMQAWLDYQDRGLRMIQVLLVGSPMLKKMMGEPILRGWKRWSHGSYELKLLKWGHATDEARRALKRACDVLSHRANTAEPITPPRMTWFAIRKIVRESGGRPGRMNELIRRSLSASIRQGGVSITRRFLFQADALRSPALHPAKVKQAVKAKEKATAEAALPAREETKPVPQGDFAMRWMRYGLAGLLAVFIVGAGWGVHAWLKAAGKDSTPVAMAELTGGEIPQPEQPAPVVPITTAASQVDSFLANDLATTPAPAPVVDDIWSPLSTEVATTQVTTSSLEHSFASYSPEGSSLPAASTTTSPLSSFSPVVPPMGELALQSSEPMGPSAPVTSQPPALQTSPLPSIQEENTGGMTAASLAAVSLDPPSQPSINIKQPEILRLTGPEKALEPTPQTTEVLKPATSSSKTSGKPRLRKKTLEALAKLEKRLN